MTRLSLFFLVALLCLGTFISAVHARGDAQDDVISMHFRAHVVIAADGSLQSIEWSKDHNIPDVLRAKLEERVRGWQFAPGTIDGVPAKTRSTLRVDLTATPMEDGESYQVRVDDALVGPSMSNPTPPDYPRDALSVGAEALVVVQVHIDADGERRVDITRYEGSKSRRAMFEKAVLANIGQKAFHPEQVGPHTIAASFTIPMTFCLSDVDDASDTGCDDKEWDMDLAEGTSVATAAIGGTLTDGSVAKLVTEVRGSSI